MVCRRVAFWLAGVIAIGAASVLAEPAASSGPATKPVRPAASHARLSADGVPFPEASDALGIKIELPLIRDRLGALPEEFGRVFSTAKSTALLSKHGHDGTACAWFAWGTGGADLIGIDLAGGRVSRVILSFDTDRPTMPKTIAGEMARLGKETPAGSGAYVIKRDAGAAPVIIHMHASTKQVEFSFDAIDLYIVTHDVPAPVAAAMRARHIVAGMTLDQATLVLGEPEKTEEWTDKKILEWHEWTIQKAEGIFAEPKRVSTRTVRVTFEDGKATGVEDSK